MDPAEPTELAPVPPLLTGKIPVTWDARLTVLIDIEALPPKLMDPPPESPEPGEIVIAALAKSEFDIVPSLICVVVMPPSKRETSPVVTVKNDEEKEAIP